MRKSLNLGFFFVFVFCIAGFAQNTEVNIDLKKGEHWWSGIINHSHKMPYTDTSSFSFQMLGHNAGNQVQPLLLSDKGRYVWSEEPFQFEFKNGSLSLNGRAKIDTGSFGKTLKEVQHYLRNKYFAASGKLPNTDLIKNPQYNTWIELNYNQNQADVLKYAHAIVENGFPAGVLMIDDTWQENYGVWDFHPKRFPDPKRMIKELKEMGFKVMLWICPFVSPDSKEFRALAKQSALLISDSTRHTPITVEWWNGFSGQLDFSHPAAVKWFKERLDFLQNEYGVDGFKFDAGDYEYYPVNSFSNKPITANVHSELFAKIGLSYPLNEYRACWKMGGQPLVQRLRDKDHTWVDLQKLIPDMALAGLIGYTFSCPDMIGGGEIESFWKNEKNLDQELIVRSAQCHALMPMMQFSVAPWRVLDAEHFEAVKKAVALRSRFTALMLSLANNSAQTGEPIMKSMDYVFANQNFATTIDQFMIGDSLMVTPVVTKGGLRSVRLPKLKKGKWKADDGIVYKSGTTITINVPLNRLPYFEIVK